MAEFEIKCPHCGVALSIQEEWIGMTLECPTCKQNFPVQRNPVQSFQGNTSQAGNSGTFTFVCPSCGTMEELPVSLLGKQYECSACGEEAIANPATEKKCPHCGNSIKIQARICKYCKKEVSSGSLNNKIMQKSKDVLSASLQVTKKIKSRLNLKRSIFIVSCLFFLAACIVFVFAIFTRGSGAYGDGSGSESVSTSSYSSISVGESSYGTYKNARVTADNTQIMINQLKIAKLFNISRCLFAMAIFLLLVSFFIDQIFDKKEIIAGDQEQKNEHV